MPIRLFILLALALLAFASDPLESFLRPKGIGPTESMTWWLLSPGPDYTLNETSQIEVAKGSLLKLNTANKKTL